jgi:hypothetical protein
MIKAIAERENCYITGEHIEKHFLDAGFVDIEVIKKTIHIGDWGGGPP